MYGEAVLTNCEKCTKTQKEWLKKTIKWYAQNDIEKLLQTIAKAGEDMKQKALINN